MIGFIVLGLAFVFFCVLAYFATRTWYTSHVVAMAFLFLFTLAFLFLSATYFRCLEKFRPAFDRDSQRLAQLETENTRLLNGPPGEAAGVDSKEGETNLARTQQFTRGRIWRNVTRVPGPQGQIVVSMQNWSNDGCMKVGNEDEFGDDELEPVEDPELAADDEGADAAPVDDASDHGLVQGQSVYAFIEFPIASVLSPAEKQHYFGELSDGEENFADSDKRGRCRVPLIFLGKFAVESLAGNNIVLAVAGGLDQVQQQQLSRPPAKGTSWVLYEQLPTDSHDLFDGVEGDKIAGLIPLQRLTQMGIRIPPAAYNAMIAEYKQDGKSITPGQARDPLRVAVEVEFLKPHTVEVDLSVEGGLPEGSGQPFNVDGRAQLASLLQGEPTQFEPGDVAVFNGAEAQRLVDIQKAKIVGAKYVRQLRDFEYLVQNHQEQFSEVGGELAAIQAKVKQLDESLAGLQDQIDRQAAEYQLLEADLKGFRTERDALAQYYNQLKGRHAMLRQRIGELTGAAGI